MRRPDLCQKMFVGLCVVAVLMAAVPVALAADPGERVFRKCKACHTVGKGGANLTGPNLWGVFSRGAAALDGYRYSGGLKKKAADGLAWDDQTLDQYLASPATFVPGSNMNFAGLRREKDRAAVISWLRKQTGD